ncbi:MAG TPA: O-antigen ligase family protein, partial [Candidatus Acidoferrum sp.]|nr:O-antigen ligase family protein [Candidatus Acidoferrum sp.]
MDLGRPSAQHRAAAWRAGFEMMRDYPFGVGWSNAVRIYEEHYSPPENGAEAIATNDYLMIGTQLGVPALVCFITYVTLQLGVGKRRLEVRKKEMDKKSFRGDVRATTLDIRHETLDLTKVACHAAVIAMLVGFWFDGGLFELPTAAVFWILLELGAVARSPVALSQKAA